MDAAWIEAVAAGVAPLAFVLPAGFFWGVRQALRTRNIRRSLFAGSSGADLIRALGFRAFLAWLLSWHFRSRPSSYRGVPPCAWRSWGRSSSCTRRESASSARSAVKSVPEPPERAALFSYSADRSRRAEH